MITNIARRIAALAAVFAMGLMLPLSPAQAQTPTYKPLLSRDGGTVKPNLVFNLDDSGSMQYRYMPERSFLVGSYTVSFPDDDSMAIHPQEDTIFHNAVSNNVSFYSGVAWADPGSTNLLQRQMRSPDVNSLYYNPEIRYLPWVNSDGSRMPNATPTSVRLNPINFGVTATLSLTITTVTINLTATNSSSNFWCGGITGTAAAPVLVCGTTRTAVTTALTTPVGWTATSKVFAPGLYYRLSTTVAGFRDPNVAGNYVQYDINVPPAGGVFRKYTNRSDCTASPSSCSQAEETQNFANWFQYYRSRLLLAGGSVPEAFATLDDKVRLGWGTIHNNYTSIDGVNTGVLHAGVRDYNTTTKASFFDWVRKRPTFSGTPLRQAMYAVGEYYTRSDARSPWADDPAAGGAAAHKTCRRAYHMLVTDGYWNDTGASVKTDGVTLTVPASIGNSDGVAGPVHSGPGRDSTGYSPARPYQDNSTTTTLADVAMHFWKNDLRGTTTGSPSLDNKVQPTADNPAFWQHMVNYTVGLGVKGLLDPNTDLPALVSGSKAWTTDKIDDLWHAALNSRGDYFSARDPSELTGALRTALTRASERDLLEAGVATASTTLEAGNRKYIPRYKTAVWSGDVEAYFLDENGVAGAKAWGAKDKVPAWASRNIVTWDQGLGTPAGVTFTWAAMSVGNQTAISTVSGSVTGTLVDYLRGDRTNEAADGMRIRESVLGDVINSNPVFAKEGFDGGHLGLPTIGTSYGVYVNNTKKTRQGVVYVGANDGMLHGYLETKGVTPANDGKEVFAYVPRAVYGTLPVLASRTYGTTDNYHRFFVDGALVEADAYVPPPGGGAAAWRNYLLGSVGLGGRGVFAIDITDPTALGKSSVRWEINAQTDSDLGYVLAPVQYGVLQDGTWVAVFGNGYGSGATKAYLFVVNMGTGAIQKLAVDSSVTSNGLGGVSVVRDSNGYIQNLYAGDLKGKLWKFDYSALAASKFAISNLGYPLFQAQDSGGTTQPILQPPAIFNHSQGGKIVVFATGRLITDADADTTTTQTMYGVRDYAPQVVAPLLTLPFTRSTLVARTITAFTGSGGASSQTFFDITGGAVDWVAKRGWMIDLTVTGYTGLRVIYPPQAVDSSFVYISSIAPAQNLVVCETTTGRGANFLFPVETGLPSDQNVFDTNADGVINSTDQRSAGFAGNADGVDAILRGTSQTYDAGGGTTGDPCLRLSIQNTTGQMSACVKQPVSAAAASTPTARDRTWRRIMNPPIQ